MIVCAMEETTGIVVRNTGSSYVVESLCDQTLHVCRIKGNFRIKGLRTTNPVAVGDIVRFTAAQPPAEGLIHAIEPRKNYIIRRSTNLSKDYHILAANLDNVFLVVTLILPRTSFEFIDRFLVCCEAYKIPVTIVLNKIDLADDEDIDYFTTLYNRAGYEVLPVSALRGEGLAPIAEKMTGKVSLFAGNSGVGKSSLIGSLVPGLEIKTGDISHSHFKGRHTTTFSQMFKIGEATYLIDTPGVKGFGLIDVADDELARYFPDLFRHAEHCQYYNCTHTHEPNCNVKEMVEQGEIAAERYESYLKMLEDEKGKYR